MSHPFDDGAPDVVSAQGLAGCVINGCGRKIVGRGRCRRHYQRWWMANRGAFTEPALNLKTKTPDERFWEKVDVKGPDDCWPWQASTNGFGHGEFFVSRERGTVPAHVYALELECGEPPTPGTEGCHRCDNPPCCNPAHIYYGTRAQNVQDMWDRGRGRRGSVCTQAKLTEDDVLAIRQEFASGMTEPQLSSKYGVSQSMIGHIACGKRWRHVGGPIRSDVTAGRRPNRKDAS